MTFIVETLVYYQEKSWSWKAFPLFTETLFNFVR